MRASDFPSHDNASETKFEQPATRPHSDVTASTVVKSCRRAYPQHDGYFDGKDVEMIKWDLI